MSVNGAVMDEDDELDALRRKRAQELQAQAEARQDAQEHDAEIEAARSQVLWQILTPEARERLAALRMARPEFAKAIEERLIALAQSGRLGDQKITDEVLKEILARSSSNKRDINIERR